MRSFEVTSTVIPVPPLQTRLYCWLWGFWMARSLFKFLVKYKKELNRLIHSSPGFASSERTSKDFSAAKYQSTSRLQSSRLPSFVLLLECTGADFSAKMHQSTSKLQSSRPHSRKEPSSSNSGLLYGRSEYSTVTSLSFTKERDDSCHLLQQAVQVTTDCFAIVFKYIPPSVKSSNKDVHLRNSLNYINNVFFRIHVLLSVT